MKDQHLSPRNLIVLFIVFGMVIAVLETFVNQTSDGTLLLTLTFWTMLVQGAVSLAAVGETAKGLWLIPIKRELLCLYPLLLFMALLYLLMGMRMDIYPWTAHPNAWLNARFFIVRNFVVMMLAFWVAHLLARSVMRGDPKKNTYAVLYILLFVTSQSLVAFDWIMSLEYPWISTLFGGHFFIQSFLMGLLFSAVVIFFRTRVGVTGLTETLRDTGKMMFGFSFMWGGFLFAQYLTIWYGNIPEEVSFILKRVDPAPYWGLSRLALALIFAIPFLALLSRKLKTMPAGMLFVVLSSVVGLFIEKIILITPVVPVNPVVVGIEFFAMIVLVTLVFRTRDSFMPQLVTDPGGVGSVRAPSG
ncbi:MAG: hypothetical protein OEN01_13165 [Candidatus Krumholzibacteria bacterium]|nr:hypothetical protein [Candidatus Krumholzibacteria bacterium]